MKVSRSCDTAQTVEWVVCRWTSKSGGGERKRERFGRFRKVGIKWRGDSQEQRQWQLLRQLKMHSPAKQRHGNRDMRRMNLNCFEKRQQEYTSSKSDDDDEEDAPYSPMTDRTKPVQRKAESQLVNFNFVVSPCALFVWSAIIGSRCFVISATPHPCHCSCTSRATLRDFRLLRRRHRASARPPPGSFRPPVLYNLILDNPFTFDR